MEWDECAAGWDDQPGVRPYAKAAYRSLVSAAEAVGVEIVGSRLCDFGCGTGLLTEQLVVSCRRIDAVDSSPGMLDVLRRKIAIHGWDNVRVFERLPPQREHYDLVLGSSVCAFVDDYPGLVRQLVSAMAPDGLFVQWDWELDPRDDEPFGLTRGEIRRALDAAGLVSVTVDTGFEVTADDQTMRPLMGVGRRPS